MRDPRRLGDGPRAERVPQVLIEVAQIDLPIGRRMSYAGRSPDTELLRRDLGLHAEFRVVLEWGPAGLLVFGLGPLWSRLGPRARFRVAHVLAAISRPFGRFGSEGGCLQVDLGGGEQRLSVTALSGDQRLGILPCAMALQRLLEGDLPERRVVHPAAWLSPRTGIGELGTRGVRVLTVPSARVGSPNGRRTAPLEPE